MPVPHPTSRTSIPSWEETSSARFPSPRRVLPLDRTLIAQLRAFMLASRPRGLEPGPAYQDSGYVCCYEFGAPSDPARRASARVGPRHAGTSPTVRSGR
jgi:hypothetical protein